MAKVKPVKRHAFRFKIRGGDGEKRSLISSWAKVRDARSPVTITLTADMVRKSIALKGVGNTQTCSMAICAKAHKNSFSHNVEPYIDWTYTRCWVASKTVNGLPTECFVYGHGSEIAQLNDTVGGQKKLLANIENNGPMVVTLKPLPKVRVAERKANRKPFINKPHKERLDGSRTAKGAKLRIAMANLGEA